MASPPHMIAIQSFVIINFFVCVFLSYLTSSGCLCWAHEHPVEGKRMSGVAPGAAHLVFSIVLFGLLAGFFEKLTGDDVASAQASMNSAGIFMIVFGLLFAVLEFFAGLTMFERGLKKMAQLDAATVSTTSKVALAIGALAFGFACRHINLGLDAAQGSETPLIHAIESFIIINFFLTWLVDVLAVKGKIEW